MADPNVSSLKVKNCFHYNEGSTVVSKARINLTDMADHTPNTMDSATTTNDSSSTLVLHFNTS